MTPAHDSETSMTFDLTSPKFRFPVKTGKPQEQTVVQLAQADGTLVRATIHEPGARVPSPHIPPTEFTPHEAGRYVGWSIQDISWTGSTSTPAGDPIPQPTPALNLQPPSTGISQTELAPNQIEPELFEPAAETRATSESPETIPFARPLELPGRSSSGADMATQWSASSRAQVTGFAILRTRIDQPQAMVTGAGLASGHRRWAARNHSAELQSRSVIEMQSLERASEPAAASTVRVDCEIVSAHRPSRLSGGGLPLIVHPDFRWPKVVEQLSTGGVFADQLLAAAEELLAAAQGRLIVAGTRRQQGVTTMAATISRMLVERGRRVLMVDADLASGGWTGELELQSAGTWVRQVEQFEPLQAAMAISRRTSSAFVGLQAVGSRRELPPFLFDYLGQLLAPIAGQFDATVIEVGPVSQLLEELSQPLRLGSAVLIVQQQGAEAVLEMRRTKTTLNAFGLSRLAIAQNFAA